ncbi:DMT family transporter [Microterricola viridarii]|uniref:Small multidrug resistance pump n=1 Tax=Microterricola viridarii TaxID=412690 RepID=A0A1H1ZAD0_9MICO|nr:SMR family transporter [Microterricola viridarii]SDT30755.1 small multidrug resistance pump [Microterricola viridarii]
MTKWLLLAGAIVCEVAASLSLQAAIDQPLWYIVVVIGYVTAFTLLFVLLRSGAAIGVVYGIWGACGVVLTAALAAVLFGQTLTPSMIGGIALVVAGVLCVEMGSQRAHARKARADAHAAAGA